MPSLGVVLVPTLPPEELRGLAASAQEHLDELWLWEDCFKESSIAAAAAALAWTEKITVGIGLAPVPLRNVALLAMEIATVHRLFPGRFLPGVGHGVQDWMGQVGARAASPLTRLDEHTSALRRLLDGEEVSVEGRYVTLDRVTLDWPPPQGTPLLVGGGGPKTLELAGRLGDGVIIGSAVPLDGLDAARESALTGWRAGRGADGATLPFVTHLIVATGDVAQARLDEELGRFWDHTAGDLGCGVAGDADAVAAAVRAHAERGATTVILQPTRDEPDLHGLVRFFGQDVRAALGRDVG